MTVRQLTLLEEIKETQRIHTSLLQAIMRQLTAVKERGVLPEGIHLPIRTIEEFDNIDKLAANLPFQNALVSLCIIYANCIVFFLI